MLHGINLGTIRQLSPRGAGYWGPSAEVLNSTLQRPVERLSPFANSLEPPELVERFKRNPPVGFAVHDISLDGQPAAPAFKALYNVLTTLDDEENRFVKALRSSRLIGKLCSVPTLFVGTTVSEYATYPHLADFHPLIQRILHVARIERSDLIILKDIPSESPLLSSHANAAAGRLIETCKSAGFTIVEGQALAYVPIDFATMDEYLTTKLSSSRRKEFRKKLKSRAQVKVELVRTGDSIFRDEQFCDELYRLYLNVYGQSKYHFDQLTRAFFTEVFQDAAANGVVFLYRRQDDGRLIAWNLCYEYGGYLVDKYVGFEYPDVRQLNIYFISWFENLEYAISRGLSHYIAGWTDPEVKTSLGAKFTFTRHAVYAQNWILRMILNNLQHLFEPDANWAARAGQGK